MDGACAPPPDSDAELLHQVLLLVARERETLVELLVVLAELDARRLYLGLGCASLFAYCTEVLRLSEAGAYRRITAARIARRFPRALEHLAQGSLNLSTLSLLSSVLTSENATALLEQAAGCSKREVEAIVAQERARLTYGRAEWARHRPTPSPCLQGNAGRRGSGRDLGRPGQGPERCDSGDGAAGIDGPPPVADPPRTDLPGGTGGGIAAPGPQADVSASPMTVTTDPTGVPAPGPVRLDLPVAASVPARFAEDHSTLAGGRTLLFPARSAPSPFRRRPDHLLEFRVIVDHETASLFRQAQDLLRHQIPDGDAERILRAALCALIDRVERRRRGAGGRQPAARAPEDTEPLDLGSGPTHRSAEVGSAPPHLTARRCTQSRYIPVAVRRAVWDRDGARCAFRSDDGHRCTNRALLQFHHHDPFCRGGAHHVENLSLRCSAHNRYHAEQDLGADLAQARRAPGRRGARHERDLPDERAAGDARIAREAGDAPAAGDARDARDVRDAGDTRRAGRTLPGESWGPAGPSRLWTGGGQPP